MKHLLLFTLLFWGYYSTAQSDLSAKSQTTPTPEAWQADLRFLQQTVHKDYPFLFKKITAGDWDAAVENLYTSIPSLQPHEVLAGFGRLVSLFGYGHTDISWSRAPVKAHIVPLNLYWFSDGIYVEGCHKDYSEALSAKILKVEGLPVEKAFEQVKPLLPAENDMYAKAYALDFLMIPEALHAQGITPSLKKTITLTLERDGKSFDKTFDAVETFRFPRKYGLVTAGGDWLSARDQNATPYYLRHLDKIYYFEYLPEQKTVYIRHSQIQDDPSEPIPAFYRRVFDFIEKNEVETLVLDLRLNGGGNNYKNKPIVTGIIESKKINQPGKLFVLIGRRTFSACQNLVNELHNYTNAVFVGEPTGENINFYGDNRRVELPNSKLPVILSFAWWQDKPQWENADWLAPQIAADMSFADYCANRDPFLETALNTSVEGIVLDPMDYLKSLFMANKREELRAAAAEMVRDPKYRYYNFESKINQAGYDMLQRSQIEPALFVFQLNTQLFPQSANTWDSLGEVYLAARQPEKAIEYYNKAIELDPDGSVGANARRMLEEIKNSH